MGSGKMDKRYDVVVIGGGIAGVSSAIAASRQGARVLLLERSMSFGGVLTTALVNPMMTFHSPVRQVIGGIGQEIVDRLIGMKGSFGHIDDPIGFVSSITPFDPEKLKSVLICMLKEAGVNYMFGALVTDVFSKNRFVREVEVSTQSGRFTIKGSVFVDSTGEGNLSIRAGAGYFKGDGDQTSCQPMTLVMRIRGVDREVITSYVKDHREDFVLSDTTDLSYLGIAGFFSFMPRLRKYAVSFKRDRLLFFEIPSHPGEVFMNTTRYPGDGSNVIELTEAQSKGNCDVWKFMEFLKNEIPGFSNAALVQTGCSIGVRETTHVVGDYVIKVDDLLKRKQFADSIAVGAYPVDLHMPGSEGLKTMKIPFPGEYYVPLRALFPTGIENVVLAGRALSAEHLAFSALRTSPLASATGMAAGICAAMSLGSGLKVREVPFGSVQREIVRMGGVFE